MKGEIKSFNPVTGKPNIERQKIDRELIGNAVWLTIVTVFLIGMLAR